MEEGDDQKFMRRCIELALKAEGMTYPNPLVGSVIVNGGKIIGEGYHVKSGFPHAEVNAINTVKDRSLLRDSTLYVNLEPCSHYGKTPPCADFIIENSIPRVVVGAIDTSSKVSGKGIGKLQSAGCEVIAGVLEQDCRWLNRRFYKFHEENRPWIILKWAQSADGFMDILRKENSSPGPNWITGKPERVLVHRWRSQEQSILAGAVTIRADNPGLNVREWAGSDPLRMVLSSSGNINQLKVPGSSFVFTHNKSANIPGSETVVLSRDQPSCRQVAGLLHDMGIQSLFIEGGARVLSHFIEYGLWDEARVFTGHARFKKGVRAPEINGKINSAAEFSGSTLKIFVRET
jgi:diaminohydroxyphosphoribosylaminopyrimidine deaminase / 5-amino-6-(5-phosphoribosylamino)uracil reductase